MDKIVVPYEKDTPEYHAYLEGHEDRIRGRSYDNSYPLRSSQWAAYRKGYIVDKDLPDNEHHADLPVGL